MKHIKLMLMAGLMSIGLSGCFLSETNYESGNFCSPSAFRTVFMNNANMAGLYVGQEAEDVLSRMGQPVSQSQFRLKSGDVVTAWFYQINIGAPCRGFEGDYLYEPVFMSQGELIGVGHRYYKHVIAPNSSHKFFGGYPQQGQQPSRYDGAFQESF